MLGLTAAITFALWLLFMWRRTHNIYLDSEYKVKYFGKELMERLRDHNQALIANTIQQAKVTEVWSTWLTNMVELKKTIRSIIFIDIAALAAVSFLSLPQSLLVVVAVVGVAFISLSYAGAATYAKVIDVYGGGINNLVGLLDMKASKEVKENTHTFTPEENQRIEDALKSFSERSFWEHIVSLKVLHIPYGNSTASKKSED